MGNLCHKKTKESGIPDDNDATIKVNGVIPSSTITSLSPVQQWEDRQKELNVLIMEKMREDFHNRPDNFLLNLLVSSTQFYKNFSKEKVEISNHIRDREQALSNKLTPSKRKIIYLGGFEEISGTHVLYQSKDEKYMELPSPLQIYVVQDNLEVYPDDEYEELQQRNYADLDGPSYRFCTEYSKRHIGYGRLRCADIIPGMSRSNTYEDIYAFMAPVDDTQPDPVVDRRPLRRNSLISNPDYDDPMPRPSTSTYPHTSSVSSFEEEEEEEEMEAPSPSLMGRRPSGILPLHYPTGSLLGNSSKKKEPLKTGIAGGKDPPNVSRKENRANLTERRPSGLFPKMNPNMDKLSFSKNERNKIKTEDEFADLKRILAGIEEESEEEEDEVDNKNTSGIKINNVLPLKVLPPEVLEPPKEEEEEKTPVKPKEPPRLHATLNNGCFVNRKIKLKHEDDAYGLQTRTELRTYFSSERYLECFEDDFEDLVSILGKQRLADTCVIQTPAILASELMIEEIGPKFNTEFIPTMILKEWPRCAFEWKLRDRKPRPDPETKTVYRWPKPHSINEVTKMGCNLVPIGHYNPTRPNAVMKIEWQIQFARAEQLLLRSLGHTQIRLLILVEFLIRDHLKDIPGLKNQHLRYILFWMCEHNFRDWQEERLGNKLKAYFKTLYNCLSTENLPHYFIDKCNLMDTIPERYLRQIQALIRNMKDNLPIYLMHTMRRMRTQNDYYPQLNIKELYKLVTPKKYGMENINPALLQLMGGNENQVDDGEDVLFTDSEDEKEHAKEKAMLHNLRAQKNAKEKGTAAQETKAKRKHSTINLRKKVNSVKDLRAGKLLTLFAKHFIEMARCSNEYRSYPQAYMYLLLAGNMATLLEETGNGPEAEEFKKEIEELNFASRGGVQDMLGSSWAMNENYDLIPGNPAFRGSNWELKKEQQPLPKPPKNTSPISGVKISRNKYMEGMESNLSQLENTINSKPKLLHTLSNESSWSDSITDLPDSGPQQQQSNRMIIISDDEDFGSTDL